MKTAGVALVLLVGTPMVGAIETRPAGAPRLPAGAKTVSVSGEGRAMVTPDRATFTVGVQTAAPTVAAAVQDNNDRVQAIISAMRTLGVSESNVRTSQISVFPQQDHQPGKPPRILGYQVTNTVTVSRVPPGDLGRLLQAAVDAGANNVSGVHFTVSDPARGGEAALQAAFADARTKADVLARAAGRSVGRAISITEGAAVAPPPPYPRPRVALMESQADIPVAAGAELTFIVSVLIELR
jgi:uncharacterized protein YggE